MLTRRLLTVIVRTVTLCPCVSKLVFFTLLCLVIGFVELFLNRRGGVKDRNEGKQCRSGLAVGFFIRNPCCQFFGFMGPHSENISRLTRYSCQILQVYYLAAVKSAVGLVKTVQFGVDGWGKFK